MEIPDGRLPGLGMATLAGIDSLSVRGHREPRGPTRWLRAAYATSGRRRRVRGYWRSEVMHLW